MQLDQQETIAGGQLGPSVKTLSGETSVRTAAVQVELTAAAGADKSRVRLTCQDDSAGTWYTLVDLPAGALAVGSTRRWEGEIHQGSACRLVLTPAAGVSGNVKACGKTVKEWTGEAADSKTVDFSAYSDACAIPGCPAKPSVAGVQGVDLAFRSVLPGSAFVNEAPLAGEILHLPFEDTTGSNGVLTLRDVSGGGSNGSCSSGACPIPGQASPSGSAAFFDGVNDAVRVPQVAGQGTTNYLSVAAWIYPTKRSDGSWNRGTFISRYGLWDVACTSDGLIRWVFRNTSPGNVLVSTGYMAALNRWTHIAVIYDAGVIRTYANGVLVHTYNGSGSISNANVLDIGGEPPWSEWFTGSLDDVRLFNRALTVDEIKALYLGSGPVLQLGFEQPWATEGTSLADASGWGHDATLHTGDKRCRKQGGRRSGRQLTR